MRVLTAAELREVDRRAVEEIGIPMLCLMENAGRAVAEALEDALGASQPGDNAAPDASEISLLVVAGRGNNGGDGLVAARHLANRGHAVQVLLLARVDELRSETVRGHARALVAMGVPVLETATEADLESAPDFASFDVVVDAIFGTGFRPPAKGLEAAAIAAIAEAGAAGAFVLAVDLPSGLDADSGRIEGPAVAADLTVTFAAPKLAHFLAPADELSGDVLVADISIPRTLIDSGAASGITLLDEDAALPALTPRAAAAHKGDFGHLLLVAGSRGKTGAAILAARAALRAGAGLVTVATPMSCLPLVAAGAPEIMTEPLAETKDGFGALAEGALDRIRELLATRTALAIGPGIGTHPATVRLVRAVLELPGRPATIVDADALNAIGTELASLRAGGTATVLTPHPGEAGRLLGRTAGDVNADRIAAARTLAEATGCTVVLKGHRTIVATPDGALRINTTGGPALATGGTGDVLTGLTGALLAQGVAPVEAACAAVFLHGLAGDLAEERHGEGSVVASDVLDSIAAARASLASADAGTRARSSGSRARHGAPLFRGAEDRDGDSDGDGDDDRVDDGSDGDGGGGDARG